MLKKTLWRAGFFVQALVLIAAGNKALVQQEPADTDTMPEKAKTFSLRVIDSSFSDSANSLTELPSAPLNAQAAKFVKQYLKAHSTSLSEVEKRSPKYFTVIDSVFSANGLPVELKYLSVIESRLQSRAVSPVGAVGVWQFMPETGKAMGLKVTAKYDERKHFYKSTIAAAKYLKWLHKIFDDWLLVIAAYNGGPGVVFNAIKKSGSRNFWKMQYHMPAETRNHVKRFIGAHYYFEKTGSVTTLTKTELAAYQMNLATFAIAQNTMQNEPADIVLAVNELK